MKHAIWVWWKHVMFKLGWIPRDENLKYARACMEVIQRLPGSVPHNVSVSTKHIMFGVLERLLVAIPKEIMPPKVFRHNWEAQAWKEHMDKVGEKIELVQESGLSAETEERLKALEFPKALVQNLDN